MKIGTKLMIGYSVKFIFYCLIVALLDNFIGREFNAELAAITAFYVVWMEDRVKEKTKNDE